MKTKESLTESELYNMGAAMCAGCEHCRAEVKARLLRGTDDEALCERVLDRLVSDRFIDEERYVRAFISDKLRFARWGRRKMKQELWMKQVPETVWRPLLEGLDERLYEETLRDLLQAKSRSVKGRNEYERKMKLARFAMGRGFEPAYIYRYLDLDDLFPEEEY